MEKIPCEFHHLLEFSVMLADFTCLFVSSILFFLASRAECPECRC